MLLVHNNLLLSNFGKVGVVGDWQEWIRRFSIELLKESPSPALRACASLAGIYQPLRSIPCVLEMLLVHNNLLLSNFGKVGVVGGERIDPSQKSTRDDWQEWIRRFSIELLKESPSPALRACASFSIERTSSSWY
jgi:phosphatidylinositol kinase/protein kinase (PI-3  family)